MRKSCLALVVAGLLAALPALADVHFGVGLGADYSTPVSSASNALTFTPKVGFPGGGIFLGVDLSDSFEIYIDALLLKRSFSDGFNNVSGMFMQGDLLFRYMLWDVLHFGVGGYYSNGIDNLSVGGSSTPYVNYGLKPEDYGAVGSLALVIPLGGISLYVDGRFNYGLANVASVSSLTVHYRDFEGLIGVQFGDPRRGYAY